MLKSFELGTSLAQRLAPETRYPVPVARAWLRIVRERFKRPLNIRERYADAFGDNDQ
ncbi:hypothetical protein GCM10027298_34980 [Epidermidibacterium keratini]